MTIKLNQDSINIALNSTQVVQWESTPSLCVPEYLKNKALNSVWLIQAYICFTFCSCK